MISGVRLTWTPLVVTGACPWCHDAKQFASANGHLWKIGAGHTCSHPSWGVWEIFRYACWWPQSAENAPQGLAFVVMLQDDYERLKKKKKSTEENKYSGSHIFWRMISFLVICRCPWGTQVLMTKIMLCILIPEHRGTTLGVALMAAHWNYLWLLFFPVLKFLEARGDVSFTFVSPVPSVMLAMV